MSDPMTASKSWLRKPVKPGTVDFHPVKPFAARRDHRPPSTPSQRLKPTLSGNSLALLDDLVGAGEDRWRHGETERVRGLQIDDQLEPGRLLHRQIGGLGSLKYPSGVNGDLTPCADEAWPIADPHS